MITKIKTLVVFLALVESLKSKAFCAKYLNLVYINYLIKNRGCETLKTWLPKLEIKNIISYLLSSNNFALYLYKSNTSSFSLRSNSSSLIKEESESYTIRKYFGSSKNLHHNFQKFFYNRKFFLLLVIFSNKNYQPLHPQYFSPYQYHWLSLKVYSNSCLSLQYKILVLHALQSPLIHQPKFVGLLF